MKLSRFRKMLNKFTQADGRDELITRLTSGLYENPLVRKVVGLFYASNKEPEQWVFLLGCYNSGTTILRDVLGSHPSIGTMPREGVKLTNVFPTPEKLGWYRMTSRCPAGAMIPEMTDAVSVRESLVKDWAPWLNSGKPVFLEKSITHAARLDWLRTVFPDAKFIVIHRDGYSSAEGIQRKARAVGVAKIELGQELYPISDCAQEWSQLNSNLLSFSEKNNDIDVKILTYEKLCASPSSEIASLFEFVGVSLDAFKVVDEKTVLVGKRTFEIKNMNERSHKRLSNQDYQDINDVAGDTLRQLGYFRGVLENG